MLTFKNTSILFCFLFIVLIACDIFYNIRWYHYFIIFFLYSIALAYGSAYVASDFYTRVISSGPRHSKQLAITFDDGPADQYTNDILNILDSEKVGAAFFCIGKNIAGRELLINRITTSGHIIGNHSYSHHFWFDMYSSEKMTADLRQMNQSTFDVTGLKPRLFRPPYGVTNPNLARAIKNQKLVPVGWNIRSLDTIVKDPQKLLDKVMKAVKPGAIILFHDTSEATFIMLPAFIERVKEQGYQIVRLDKMLNIAPYA